MEYLEISKIINQIGNEKSGGIDRKKILLVESFDQVLSDKEDSEEESFIIDIAKNKNKEKKKEKESERKDKVKEKKSEKKEKVKEKVKEKKSEKVDPIELCRTRIEEIINQYGGDSENEERGY